VKGTNYIRIPARYAKEIAEGGARIEPNPPFFAVDPDIFNRKESTDPDVWWSGYKDEEITNRLLKTLARQYPEYALLVPIGRSLLGRTVYALKISDHPGRDEDEPAFLFNGAHHGNEPLSIDYVLDIARYLLENSRTRRDPIAYRAITEGVVWCIPIVNPDGVHLFWNFDSGAGRKNGRDTTPPRGWNRTDGVDLNRNYPFLWGAGHAGGSSSDPAHHLYHGRSPASEPEVRNMMRLAERYRFVFSVSFHTFATKILVPYTIDSAQTPFPNVAAIIAERLAGIGESHRPEKPYTARKKLYSVDGTDQDWLFHRYGTLAFIVEGSFQTPEYRVGLQSIDGMRPISLGVLRSFFEGPTLQIHVRNSSGKPVIATVELNDQVLFEHETWRTDPTFGRFDTVLAREGRYSVTLHATGYRSRTIRIDCKRGITRVEIVLERV